MFPALRLTPVSGYAGHARLAPVAITSPQAMLAAGGAGFYRGYR